MAKAEKNHAFMNSPPSYSPIFTVNQQLGGMRNKEVVYEDPSSAPSGCFCFGFRLNRRDYHQQTQRTGERRRNESSWVMEKFNKIKEFSEVIAGPNWKNFVRKVGKYLNPNNMKKKQRTAEEAEATTTTTTTTNWMYSPNSYAMNFDKGNDYEDEDNYLCSFSSRYSVAAVPPPHLPSNRNNDDSNSEAPTVKAGVL